MPSWTSSHAIASVAHSRRKHPKKGRPTRARIAESSQGSSCAPSRRPRERRPVPSNTGDKRPGVRPADLMPCRANDKVQIANERVSFYRVPNQSCGPPAGGCSRTGVVKSTFKIRPHANEIRRISTSTCVVRCRNTEHLYRQLTLSIYRLRHPEMVFVNRGVQRLTVDCATGRGIYNLIFLRSAHISNRRIVGKDLDSMSYTLLSPVILEK